MTLDLIFFLLLSLICISTALGMLLSRNAVYSALFLVLNFITVAVFYLLLGAPFIAMAQVTVYAGAIMVLFLFVIMLLGAESLPQAQVLPWQKPLAGLLAVALAV
jgi:NADH-quinone oxidoreductase subunit J